ncbi:MAG: prepilin peptidase [Lachnospiraceae bacterium]|nr:prepilin peptidase [Lachnospiraceae bacterium]
MVALFLLLSGAVIFDFTGEKIPNFIILSGLVMGLFYRFIICGETRVSCILLDIALPFLMFFLFFAVKAIGAGDVKLLMVTGLFLGSRRNLWCIFAALSVAAIYGLCRLILSHKLLLRVGSLFRYLRYLVSAIRNRNGEIVPYLSGERMEKTGKIHFSLPILIGAAFSILFVK